MKAKDMPLPDISLKEQQQILDYIQAVHTEEKIKHNFYMVAWVSGIFIAVLLFWSISIVAYRHDHPDTGIKYMNGVPYKLSADGKFMVRVK